MSKPRLNKLNCQLCGRYASVGACRYIGTYIDTYAYAYLCMRTARTGKSIRHNEVATLVMEVRRPVPCAQQRDRSACEVRIASTTFIQWSSRSAVAFGQSCSSAHRTSNSKSRAGEPRCSPGIVSDRPCQYGIQTAHMLSKYAMVPYLRFTQSAGKAWSPLVGACAGVDNDWHAGSRRQALRLGHVRGRHSSSVVSATELDSRCKLQRHLDYSFTVSMQRCTSPV